jgi:predicted small secreted protein
MKYWSFILLTSLCVLSACNTLNGVGRDLRQAGSSIQDAATP